MTNVTITPKTGSLCLETAPVLVFIKTPLAQQDWDSLVYTSRQLEGLYWNAHLSQGPPGTSIALKFNSQAHVAQAA